MRARARACARAASAPGMAFKGGSRGPSVQDPAKAVWVGNVPEDTTYQELLEFSKQIGDAKWAEIYRGTAAVGFSSPEVASAAIDALNGAQFKGINLTADKWTKKDGTPAQARWSGGKGWGKGGWKPAGGGKGWGKNGRFTGSRISEPTKTVWVGNIPEGVKYPELLELAKRVGDAKWADVWNGAGAVGFATEDDAATAVQALSGMQLGGAALVADAWARGAKKDAAETPAE